MKTTLNEIRRHYPCSDGWVNLLLSLNKIESDNEPIDLMYILKSNGIEDAVWALQCFDYKDYCLFLADVAESVLHIYEGKHSNPAPRNAIDAIRKFHSGKITKKELSTAADIARTAAAAAVDTARADAARAAAYAARAAVYTADAAADAAVYAADDRAEWGKITKLFIKHFDGENK